MARLFTIGFETASMVDGVEDPNAYFRNGPSAFAGLMVGTANSQSPGPRCGLTIATVLGRSYYFRMTYNSNGGAPGVRQIIVMPWTGSAFWYAITHETNDTIVCRDNSAGYSTIGTALGTSAPLGGGTHRIEVAWSVPAAGNGGVTCFVDGTLVAFSLSSNIGNTAFSAVEFGKLVTDDTRQPLFDDVALNDDQGSSQNNVPGSGHINLLPPISDNARAGFTGGGGGTTNLFDAVNNYVPTGAASPGTNATQIGSATSNTTDSYSPNLQTPLAVGIKPTDTVRVAQALVRVGNSTTTQRSAGIQGTSNPAITEVTANTAAAAAAAEPTGWTTVKTAPVYLPAIDPAVSPVLRVRKNTASTDNLMCDMMGLMVETLPGSADLLQAPPRPPTVRRAN